MDCALVLGREGKEEVVLRSPLMAAAGALGYDGWPREALNASVLGAWVTPVLTLNRRQGRVPSMTARTPAGVIINSGRRNLGLHSAIKRYGASWRSLALPVFVAVYAQGADDAAQLGRALDGFDWVRAAELHLGHGTTPDDLYDCVDALQSECPILCSVVVPLAPTPAFALAAEEAGACSVVVAAPPLGRWRSAEGPMVSGPLHSPGLAPQYAQLVHSIAPELTIPIFARGGLVDEALVLLASGASAIQLDSALWVRPDALEETHAALVAEMASRQVSDWQGLLEQLGLDATP